MISDLIYDIGMHNGDDTEYYLCKGFRVIGVEANPKWAEHCRTRFAAAIKDGRLEVLNVGIAPKREKLTFWVNTVNDTFSSFIKEVASRYGTDAYPVEVACMRFSDLLNQYGVPFYLKIDIEGADELCLHDLNRNDLPRFISLEAGSVQSLFLLNCLGYNAFKCLDQKRHNNPELNYSNERVVRRWFHRMLELRWQIATSLHWETFPLGPLWPLARKLFVSGQVSRTQWKFKPGSSGPFGEDTPGTWFNLSEMAYNWLHLELGYFERGNLHSGSWYDFHATRLPAPPPTSAMIPKLSVKRRWWATSRREIENFQGSH